MKIPTKIYVVLSQYDFAEDPLPYSFGDPHESFDDAVEDYIETRDKWSKDSCLLEVDGGLVSDLTEQANHLVRSRCEYRDMPLPKWLEEPIQEDDGDHEFDTRREDGTLPYTYHAYTHHGGNRK
ncbi:MAG: hypothetical protein AAFR21_17340 [Pseudomonadota bacterium]